MKELPPEEISRIRSLLLEDDTRRNRKLFTYAFDVLAAQCVVQYSIWPKPNSDVRDVLEGKVDYNALPFEDQNEVEKGIFFQGQREFIAQSVEKGLPMLCEARKSDNGYGTCLQQECPIFKPKGSDSGGQHGVCGEYKIAFRRQINALTQIPNLTRTRLVS